VPYHRPGTMVRWWSVFFLFQPDSVILFTKKWGVFWHIVGVLLFWGNWNRQCNWPTKTRSKVSSTIFLFIYSFLLFKEHVSNVPNVRIHSAYYTHTGVSSSTQTTQILQIKGLQCKDQYW